VARGSRHRCRDCVRVAGIRRNEAGSRSEGLLGLPAEIDVTAGNDNSCSLGQEALSDSEPETRGAARNQGATILQQTHGRPV
jgi:hypothetical protein